MRALLRRVWRPALLWALLMGAWMLLSVFHPLRTSFGAVSALVAVVVVSGMRLLDRESFPLHLAGRALLYLPWLAWEILKSNVRVARIILAPRLRVDPSIVHFRASQRTDLGRFIYANSITLTPGTVTTAIAGDDFEVHAIVRSEIDGSEENDMNRRVSALEGGAAPEGGGR